MNTTIRTPGSVEKDNQQRAPLVASRTPPAEHAHNNLGVAFNVTNTRLEAAEAPLPAGYHPLAG